MQNFNFGQHEEARRSDTIELVQRTPFQQSVTSLAQTLDNKSIHQYAQKETPKPDTPTFVDWDGEGDPQRPMNWSTTRKWYIITLSSLTTLCCTFTSSIFSATIGVTAKEFETSEVVMLLGVSLFVLGFALVADTGDRRPLLWGPMSEVYGRKIPIFAGLFFFAVFQIPVAVAQNLETIFIARFISGVGGSAPIGINTAMFADFCNPVHRGFASAMYSTALFMGPTLGPIIGAIVTRSHLGWRWTAWIPFILVGVLGLLGVFTIAETYPPVLLERKARKLRKDTGDQSLRAKHEQFHMSRRVYAQKYLLTPLKMIVQEPILIAITIYISVVYGLLYLTFEAYPIAFGDDRGWSPVNATLPFLSILVGTIVGSVSQIVFTTTWYRQRLVARGSMLPEDRLPLMAGGGFSLVIGLFWFGWTSNNVSWVPQVVAGVLIGLGIQQVFVCGIAYVVDVYLASAASAMAVNTFIRSAVAAGFPLFAPALFKNLGVPWATSLLGFIGVALLPCPILFILYGAKLRALSKYSPTRR